MCDSSQIVHLIQSEYFISIVSHNHQDTHSLTHSMTLIHLLQYLHLDRDHRDRQNKKPSLQAIFSKTQDLILVTRVNDEGPGFVSLVDSKKVFGLGIDGRDPCLYMDF